MTEDEWRELHLREARRLARKIDRVLASPSPRARCRAFALAESLTGYCRVLAKKGRHK